MAVDSEMLTLQGGGGGGGVSLLINSVSVKKEIQNNFPVHQSSCPKI